MTEFVNAVVNGIGLGAIYGLVSLGLVLLFKSTGILNFSHGAMMACGALVAANLADHGFWIATAVAAVTIAALGSVCYLLLLRPLVGRGLFPGVMVTIGLASVLNGGAGIVFGQGQHLMPSPVETQSYQLPADAAIPTTLVVAMIITMVAATLLAIGFRRTAVGLQLRAAASRPEIATIFGANPNRIFTVAWAVAGALAAIAGALLGSLTIVDLSIAAFALRAFAGMIVGGADSMGGALIGGVVVGVVELLSGTYFSQDYRLPSTMVLLLLFLLVRPQGLFGTRGVIRA